MLISQRNVYTKIRFFQNFSFEETISVCPAALDLMGKTTPLTVFFKQISKPAGVLKLAFILGFIVFFLCESPVVLHAQTERIVSVSHALVPAGGRFTLVRNGEIRLSYDSSTMPVEGVILRDADTIQTAAGVFAEVRVTPGNALIRVAENTMLSFDKISGLAGTMAITLMYGRIRIDQASKTETIIVNGGASTVELQNGSVNFDYIVSSSLKYKSQPVLSVSTISGRAIVIPPGTKRTRINMRQKETLTVDPQNGKTKRRSMSKDVPAYWLRVNTQSPVVISAENNGELSFSMDPINSLANLTPLEESAVLKTKGIVVGLSVLLAGVAMQSLGHFLLTDVDEIFYYGYVPIGVGSFILLSSYFYPTYVNARQLKAAKAAIK
ncbi:MAG: hypothetical protein LBK66_05035 [Spirochaetaceae bacterium]|jgi:hypothetical protein|nr:hypothetical protein [Spirochaetaceae bacterium]